MHDLAISKLNLHHNGKINNKKVKIIIKNYDMVLCYIIAAGMASTSSVLDKRKIKTLVSVSYIHYQVNYKIIK